MEKFGDRLKLLRKERHLQQSQLGELFELSPSAIGSYERNLREPSYSQLISFAEYFNVSLDYLLGRTEDRFTVDGYMAAKSYDVLELVRRSNLSLGGAELSEEDKERLCHVIVGLYWEKYSTEAGS